MNSRTARTADLKPAGSSTHLGKKRPAALPLREPTENAEDGVPLLVSLPPVRKRAQAMPYPMSPVTPSLDTDDDSESPDSSKSSSTSSTFTFNTLSPAAPHHERAFSFTACPTSPLLDDSMVYAFPPRKRPASTNVPTRSRGHSDHSDLPIIFASPLLSEDPLREGMQSPHDDRKYFHVQFLQEDSPFPKTPDC